MAARLTSSTSRLERTTDLIAASSNYTSCVWFRSTTTPSGGDYKTIFSSLNDPTYSQWAGVFSATNSLQLSLSFPTASTSAVTAVQSGWIHLAYVRSGTTQQFYVNGQSFGAPVTVNTSSFAWSLLILGYDGFSDDDGSEYAYWREWGTALTSTQVRAEYLSATAVRTSGLWTDTPLTSDLLDVSGNGHDWTASGSMSFVTNPDIPTPGVYSRLYIDSWFTAVNDPPWFIPSTFQGGWDSNPTTGAGTALIGYQGGTNNNF